MYSVFSWFKFYSWSEGSVGWPRLQWEELFEAGFTVDLVTLFPEDSLWQLCQAESTHEVLGMELVAHGTDAAAGDGLPTPVAERPPAVVVMELTEGPSIQLEEGAGRETAEAVLGAGREEKGKECRC